MIMVTIMIMVCDESDVGINDGNEANGGDSLSKIDRDDDADSGGVNSKDGGSVDGNVFRIWCVNGKGAQST